MIVCRAKIQKMLCKDDDENENENEDAASQDVEDVEKKKRILWEKKAAEERFPECLNSFQF